MLDDGLNKSRRLLAGLQKDKMRLLSLRLPNYP